MPTPTCGEVEEGTKIEDRAPIFNSTFFHDVVVWRVVLKVVYAMERLYYFYQVNRGSILTHYDHDNVFVRQPVG
jgi:hypothetical protein